VERCRSAVLKTAVSLRMGGSAPHSFKRRPPGRPNMIPRQKVKCRTKSDTSGITIGPLVL
jgi:hypothetical protein